MSNKSMAHPQQVIQMNVIFCFQEMKKGEWTWKKVFIIQTINRREQPLNTSKRGDYVLVLVKVEGQDRKMIGKRCPVFDYTEKKIFTISAYKQEMRHELEKMRKLTSSS